MARIKLVTEGVPATPASGSGTLYIDSTAKELVNLDDAGKAKVVRTLTNSGSTTTAGADIYIVGSNITVPPALVRVGAIFRWTLNISKSAACTSTPIVNIRVGTTGTVGSDTARLIFTLVAQTAATDNGLMQVFCAVTTAGASGVINGGIHMTHAGNPVGTYTAGLANIVTQVQGPTASSPAFDLTVANLIFGLSINPGNTGANAVWTIQTIAEGLNL